MKPSHFADLLMQLFSATRTALHVEELCPNAWAVIFYITEIKKVRSLRSRDVKIPGKAGLDTRKSEWNPIMRPKKHCLCMWTSLDQLHSLEMSLAISSTLVIENIYWRMHCFKETLTELPSISWNALRSPLPAEPSRTVSSTAFQVPCGEVLFDVPELNRVVNYSQSKAI